jgi:uncharacterized membrane protein
VHPMLVMFSLGFFVTAFLFDFVDVVGGPTFLGQVAYWNIVAGLLGAVMASSVSPRAQWLSRLGGVR